MKLRSLYQKIREGGRIDFSEGVQLLREAPWLELAQLAWERRVQVVPEERASYTMFRIINYTNICSVNCSFCSFKRNAGDSKSYVLNKDEVCAKIDHAISLGADQVFFQGGVNPKLPLEYYIEILQEIKQKYNIHIRAFSPVEIQHFAEQRGVSITKTLLELKEAGLDSVPGAGAEILVERVRKILSPKKCSVQEWVTIMKECHRSGLKGSANIVFGSVETEEEIIQHLEVVRSIQDETSGFNAFIPWTFQQQTRDFTLRTIPSYYYLKVLALCRLYLDNIPNIEVSVMVLGKEIGKLALRMGANDISSPVIEENVLRSYTVTSEAEARQYIEDAGFNPVRRNFDYDYDEQGSK